MQFDAMVEAADAMGSVAALLTGTWNVFGDIEPLDGETVVVRDLVASGTHTGTPYACGPCEPLPPSGQHVKCDKEELYFTFGEDGKISQLTIIPMGEMTGPQGVYTLLGGFPM